MSDADLERKFRGLAEGVLPEGHTRTLIARCWEIDQLGQAGALASAARLA